MLSFKEQLLQDLDNTFFNTMEFAEPHSVKHKMMSVVVDNELLSERKLKYAGGTYIGDILIIVRQSEYGKRPTIDEIIDFDSEIYRITDVGAEDGVYLITLEANGP